MNLQVWTLTTLGNGKLIKKQECYKVDIGFICLWCL